MLTQFVHKETLCSPVGCDILIIKGKNVFKGGGKMPLLDERLLNETLDSRVRDVTERYGTAGYFPSASVRVFDREKTLAACRTGEAREDSLFDVASLTKVATAAQVLELAERGTAALDAPIAGYFDEIARDPFLRARLSGVTVRRLLTHTSTIADWYPFYLCGGEPFFAALKTALLRTKPVSGVVYSDVNFMLLGKLVEKLRGKPLDRCLKEDLVEPLALGDMTYRPAKDLNVIASGYGNPNEMEMCRARGIAYDKFRPMNEEIRYDTHDGNAFYYFDNVAGHAGIFASPLAYEKLCRFFMNTEKPLFILAQREQPDAPGRGLGLQTGPMYPYGCGHTGFTGAMIWFSREKNIGVAAFTNRLFYRDFVNERATNDYRRALNEAVFSAVESFRALGAPRRGQRAPAARRASAKAPD